MMRKEGTVQGAFRVLQTGYGMLGPFDYARIPASSVPELSLAGDKPFTLFTTVCFKNVQGGELEGEIVTLWENRNIPLTNL